MSKLINQVRVLLCLLLLAGNTCYAAEGAFETKSETKSRLAPAASTDVRPATTTSYIDKPRPTYVIQAAQTTLFVDYVDWPGEKEKERFSKLNICLIGDSDIEKASAFIDKPRDTGKLNFKFLKLKNLKLAADACHILFIGKSEENKLSAILSEISGQPILTVSDIDSFVDNGGMIGFIEKEISGKTTIKFEVGRKAIQSAGISVNAELLAIASDVK